MMEQDDCVSLTHISRTTKKKDVSFFDFVVKRELSSTLDNTTWVNSVLFQTINDKFLHLRDSDLVYVKLFSNNGVTPEMIEHNLPYFLFYGDLNSLYLNKLIEIQNILSGEVLELDSRKTFLLRFYVIRNEREMF